MVDLIGLEKSFLANHIKEGDRVADYTMGNGHDTLWLSNTVGENGFVYAFDVQAAAIESTQKLLEAEGTYRNYQLILDSHSNLKKYIKEPIKAGVFNLGWLPGSDKVVRTMWETTEIAVRDAIEMLENDGIVLIAVYPGHEEGNYEGQMLEDMLAQYDRRRICVSCFRIVNSPASPYFYIVEKK